jgi:hypothetical protein
MADLEEIKKQVEELLKSGELREASILAEEHGIDWKAMAEELHIGCGSHDHH